MEILTTLHVVIRHMTIILINQSTVDVWRCSEDVCATLVNYNVIHKDHTILIVLTVSPSEPL